MNDPYIEANAPLFQAMALLQSSTAKLAAHDFDWLLLPYKWHYEQSIRCVNKPCNEALGAAQGSKGQTDLEL